MSKTIKPQPVKYRSIVTILDTPAPQIPVGKIGVLEENNCRIRSYNLSIEAIAAVEELTERLSQESKLRLSMSKVVELAIFHAEKKSLSELLERS